jgi:hypothetical protein
MPLANQCWIISTNSAGPGHSPQEQVAISEGLIKAMKASAVTGFDIRGQSVVSQDEMVVEFEFLPANAVEHMDFRLVDGAWKIAK